MNKDEIFAAWAPDNAAWSRWVKPVAFAHMELAATLDAVPEITTSVNWAPPISERVALIVDLPGAESVQWGLALAGRGYHAVPLFNALPMPFHVGTTNVAAVDMIPMLNALKAGAERLQRSGIPAEAPPVFLLDANRQGDTQELNPKDFDNRSVSFPSDFPSANFLAAQGIRRALLIQETRVEPQADLAHTLRRWQDGGIRLERMTLDPLTTPGPFEVSRPPWYGAMFQRALASLGLRHAWGGGFGTWLPDSAGGG